MSIWTIVGDACRATLEGTEKREVEWYAIGRPRGYAAVLGPRQDEMLCSTKLSASGPGRRSCFSSESEHSPAITRHEQCSNTFPYTRIMFARSISDVSCPPVMAVPALAVGAWASRGPATYWYAMAYFSIAVLVPVVYVVWAVRTGRIGDFHMSNRRERVAPFVVSLICGLSAWVFLIAIGAPRGF